MASSGTPPGPSGEENKRFLHEMGNDPISALTRLSRTYGRVAHFKSSGNDVYFLNSPEFVKQVSVIDHNDFVKNSGSGIKSSSGIYESLGVKGNRIFEELVGDGILMSEGELHDRHRRVMQPAFNRETLATYVPYITDLISKWRDQRKEGEVLSIRKEMQGLTLRVILKTLFSIEGPVADSLAQGLGEFGRTGEASHRSMHFLESREESGGFTGPFVGALEKLPFPSRRKYENAIAKLDRIVYGMIQQRRANPGTRRDLLSVLLETRSGKGDADELTAKEIRDEILTIILAGHDTITNALTWAWYLLSVHEDVNSKVREEVAAVLGGRTPGYDDVAKLPYTTMVFNETLRLYPPVWLERRRAIEELNVGGFSIPVGSVVLISQYVTQHDEAFYPSPESFEPGRWSADRRGSIPTFAYFPFGVGPRACIGEPFAKLEAPLIISMVSQRWRLEYASEGTPQMEPHVTLQPKAPILLKVVSG